jgi:hypothetical protein
VGVNQQESSAPEAFRRAVTELQDADWRPELRIEQMPAPQRIAPYAAAITADVIPDGEPIGSGRLVLLHDPNGNTAWDGTFRLVTFVRAEIDREMVQDWMLGQVGWSWLLESLDNHHAGYRAPSGTVTSVMSESFGGMAEEPSQAEVEIRASWTPDFDDGSGLQAQLDAWSELLCTTAGLPPLPPGVVSIPSRRSSRGRTGRSR